MALKELIWEETDEGVIHYHAPFTMEVSKIGKDMYYYSISNHNGSNVHSGQKFTQSGAMRECEDWLNATKSEQETKPVLVSDEYWHRANRAEFGRQFVVPVNDPNAPMTLKAAIHLESINDWRWMIVQVEENLVLSNGEAKHLLNAMISAELEAQRYLEQIR